MSDHEFARFPERVLKRYSEILLRHLYQSGGRERYVAVMEIEDALGLEAELILKLCRTRLRGEVHVADRLPAEIEDDDAFTTSVERVILRSCFSEPHVRVRPAAVRLTVEELLHERKGKKKRGRARRRR